MTDNPSYGWKDLFSDAVIVLVVAGAVLIIIGSFPELFGKLLPFQRQMRWPPNQAWTSTRKRIGYRHFAVRQFGGKGEERWVELVPVLKKDLCFRVPWSELKTYTEWTSGWLQLLEHEDCSTDIDENFDKGSMGYYT